MEGIYDMIILEVAYYRDFCEDLLKALNTVQHEKFKCSALKMQDEHDEWTLEMPSVIINKVATKFTSLLDLKGLLSTDSSNCLSFMTSNTTPSSTVKDGIIIEEQLKKEFPQPPHSWKRLESLALVS